MEQAKQHTRKTLAEELRCSVSSLRKYEREFSEFMKTPAGKKGKGKQREYLPEDVHTLATIHALRLQDVSFETLKGGRLAEVLDSKTVAYDAETFQTDDTEQADAALMTVDQQVGLMGKLADTAGRLSSVTSERDRLLDELDATRERLLDAEKSASRAEGELAAYKSSWWRNLFKKGGNNE